MARPAWSRPYGTFGSGRARFEVTHSKVVLGTVLDVFRVRQYFNVITRAREVIDGVREDAGFVHDVRRALVPLPYDRGNRSQAHPFPPATALRAPHLEARRIGLFATGGSGALASVVGAARAFDDAGLRPAVMSLCSASALFGFPIAAGVPADEVARFSLALRPADYLDVDWAKLASLVPTAARGFAGLLRGDQLERTYRRLLGEMTLAQMPIPAYAPIWNIETNRLEYLGPRTYPDLPVARALRMAVALPLFFDPVWLDGGWWCDGGLVDIFPVRPVLELEGGVDVAVAVNGFYPPEFAGEDATGWQDRRGSILYVAGQVRTCQQVELARANLARLRQETEVLMVEPVPYEKVRGLGFYRQFISTREWAAFMQAGRREVRRVLSARSMRVPA